MDVYPRLHRAFAFCHDFYRGLNNRDAFCFGGSVIVLFCMVVEAIGGWEYLSEVIFWAGRG
jgi:hypothetical protein